MRLVTVLSALGCALALNACSVNAEAPKLPDAPARRSSGGGDVVRVACDDSKPVNGKVHGVAWNLRKAAAFPSAFRGMWDIALHDTSGDPCYITGHGQRQVLFTVSTTPGVYELSRDATPGYATFYDSDKRADASLATFTGAIGVGAFDGDKLTGSLGLFLDADNGVCGTFEVVRCQ